MSERRRFLVAATPSPWREGLLNALETTDLDVVVTDAGTELEKALLGDQPPVQGVLLGEQLHGVGGVDALLRAGEQLARAGRARESWPVSWVFLLTDVREDVELLSHLRRRGVTHFIYRDESLEQTSLTISNVLFASDRREVRHAVRLDAWVLAGNGAHPGTIEDMSLTGARMVVPRTDRPLTPAVGDRLTIRFKFHDLEVDAAARARNLNVRKTFLGDRLVLGFSFEDMTEEVRRTVSRVLVYAARELEMASRG